MSRNRTPLLFVWVSLYFFTTFLNCSALVDGSPTPPTNIKAAAYTSSQPRVVISWNQALDNVGVTRYNIYKNGTFLFSPSGVGVTYTDVSVTLGSTYTYSIQAGDGDGNNSPQSDTIEIAVNEGALSHITASPQVIVPTSPSTPTQQVTTVFSNTSSQGEAPQITHPENVQIVVYDNQLTITWKNPTGNTFKSVRVIKKVTSYPVSPTDGIVICDSLALQCVDRDVLPGTTYYYAVYAVGQTYLASKLITITGSLVEKQQQTGTLPKISLPQKNNLQASSTLKASSLGLFTKTLQVGSSGQEVLFLQKFLNSHGYTVAITGGGSSGYETTSFGNGTQKALQAYQCQKKIVCAGTPSSTGYGMVGKTTRSFLNKEGE